MTASDLAAERTARNQLESGERLLWYGRPTVGPLERYSMRVFALGVLSAVGVGLVWIIYVLIGYWASSTPEEQSRLYTVLKTIAPIAARLGIAALGVATLAGIVGLTRGRWLAPRTVYAVTDRRVLFIQAGASARWIGHNELRDVTPTERPDGTGDLIFTRNRSSLELLNTSQVGAFPRNWLGSIVLRFGLDRWGVQTPADPGIREAFVGIANPRAVQELVRTGLAPQGNTDM